MHNSVYSHLIDLLTVRSGATDYKTCQALKKELNKTR
jgi:hypothetical protein